MKKKIRDLTLNEIIKKIEYQCDIAIGENQDCDKCPLRFDKKCIDTKVYLYDLNLDQEIEVEEDE
jgi:hypothetical protein